MDHPPAKGISVSLVEGDPAARHQRQLLLQSEGYAVRSYAMCAAMLTDPRLRDYPCIILDCEMSSMSGDALLRAMRESGWRGRAILLDTVHAQAPSRVSHEEHGDMILPHGVGDQRLLAALAASVDWGGAGSDPVG